MVELLVIAYLMLFAFALNGIMAVAMLQRVRVFNHKANIIERRLQDLKLRRRR